MKITNCYFLAIIAILMSSCNEHPKEFKLVSPSDAGKTENADFCADYVTAQFERKMYKEKGLVTIGTGGGGSPYHKGLTRLSISFEDYKEVNVAEARRLVIECADRYLADINANEDLKKYLVPNPFTIKNVDIGVLFINKKTREFVSPPFVSTAKISKGELRYTIHDNELLKTIKRETYEDAVKILESSNSTSGKPAV